MLGFKTMILLTAAATHALAATATRANLQLCGDRNFGKCEDIDFIVGDCVFAGQLNDKVSSLDTKGRFCKFYVDTGCRDGNGHIDYNGKLSDIRGDYRSVISTKNDDISSFRCY
ncbi:hypothetical protein C1H76_0881 [Elsinoe australis]|uniref:Uncharacterized protein n=1 Tax=Elsinoe australis TaxID=40998 RepID=A0A4U7BF64_9PEZI|nr:hypothetical protein C1H76_0881 [Elsinoe australis]